MPSPNASLPEVLHELAVVEMATLGVGVYGSGGLQKAFDGMPDTIAPAELPCTIHWPGSGEFNWDSDGDVPVGSETPAPLRSKVHWVWSGVVIGKRDNKLNKLTLESARWADILDEVAYCSHRTLNHKVQSAAATGYEVIFMFIGEPEYLIVAHKVRVKVRRNVISRQ